MSSPPESPTNSLYHPFSPPAYYPFPQTVDHDVYFPPFSRVPEPATAMPTYYARDPHSSGHHSRSRTHSGPYNGTPQTSSLPVIYAPTGHRSHGTQYYPSQSGYRDSGRRHNSVGNSGAYYAYPASTPTYSYGQHHRGGSAPTYYVPSSSSHHRHSPPAQVIDAGGHHHRSHSRPARVLSNTGNRHRHASHRRYSEPSMGERIRRFFGFGSRDHSHSRSRGPAQYTDAGTRPTVDSRGRAIYRV